jgi:hypothetical protein
MSSESQAPFFLARGMVLSRGYTKMRLHGTIPVVEFEICNGELETATQLVVGIGGKRKEWHAKRGQPGDAERTL